LSWHASSIEEHDLRSTRANVGSNIIFGRKLGLRRQA